MNITANPNRRPTSRRSGRERSPQTLAAALLGDPPPGRSALDRGCRPPEYEPPPRWPMFAFGGHQPPPHNSTGENNGLN